MAGTRGAGGMSAGAIWPATLAAGPVYLVSLSLGWLYLKLPQPIVIGVQDLLHFAMILVPATVVGVVLSFLPILVSATLLQALGRHVAILRFRAAWMTVGAAGGAGIASAVGIGVQEGALMFALVATGTICAAMTWRRVARSPGADDHPSRS